MERLQFRAMADTEYGVYSAAPSDIYVAHTGVPSLRRTDTFISLSAPLREPWRLADLADLQEGGVDRYLAPLAFDGLFARGQHLLVESHTLEPSVSGKAVEEPRAAGQGELLKATAARGM